MCLSGMSLSKCCWMTPIADLRRQLPQKGGGNKYKERGNKRPSIQDHYGLLHHIASGEKRKKKWYPSFCFVDFCWLQWSNSTTVQTTCTSCRQCLAGNDEGQEVMHASATRGPVRWQCHLWRLRGTVVRLCTKITQESKHSTRKYLSNPNLSAERHMICMKGREHLT